MTMHLKKNRRSLLGFALLAFLPLLFGFFGSENNDELASFNNLFSEGKYNEAAQFALTCKGDKACDSSKLLQSLQAAAALRCAGKLTESNEIFDECEEVIKYHDKKFMGCDAVSNFEALLVNDSMLDYEGAEYDGIMINTYKALNFWKAGKIDLARTEFNRALERQTRAKERYADKIQKQKEAIAQKQDEEQKKAASAGNSEPPLDYQKNLANPEVEKILQQEYSTLYEFQAYPDFINPFATYLAGLFFMSQGDYSNSVNYLKEAYGMVDKNSVVADDFAAVNKKKSSKKFVWIIFENGLGPEKEEFRMDLPLFIVSDKVQYTGIALPKLRLRESAYPHLTVKVNGKDACKTSVMASMDRVVQTEFKNEYDFILTRAIMCTLSKTYGQYQAQKKYGDWGGLAAAVYQAATTSADLRIWTSLPKEFQVAKVQTPKNGSLTLSPPSGGDITVQVAPEKSSLVYVKIPTPKAPAVYDVIPF